MKKIQIKPTSTYIGSMVKFSNDLKCHITSDVNQLITNSNVASLFIDLVEYTIDEDETYESGKPKMYKGGKLGKIQIMVDPYMSWDDNRIILTNNEIVIDEIKVIDEEGLFI